MTKNTYVVTDIMGNRPDVAGKRRWAGAEITLTEKEAEFELSRGVVITLDEHQRIAREKAQPAKPERRAPLSPVKVETGKA